MFVPNYPYHDPAWMMLSLHERTGALPDLTGRGVVMAFIDSGFYPHPDLGDRVILYVDASTDRVVERTTGFHDRHLAWHGQMTSVIAAGDGRTNGGRRYPGLASAARLILIRVATPQGRIREPDILRGLRWLDHNQARFGVRVVNISVGGDDPNDDPDYDLYTVIRSLHQAGVVITAAAGNRPEPVLVPPASAPEVITVGGYDDHNTRDVTQWSLYRHNYGTSFDQHLKPEVLGAAAWIPSPLLPGSKESREARWLAMMLHAHDQRTVNQLLLSAYPDLHLTRHQAFKPDQQVYTFIQERINHHKIIDVHHQHVDGTSVSSAVVAGIVAQMLEVNPNLQPDAVKSILQATAKQLPNVAEDRQGSGVVDAEHAVRTAAQMKGNGPLSPPF